MACIRLQWNRGVPATFTIKPYKISKYRDCSVGGCCKHADYVCAYYFDKNYNEARRRDPEYIKGKLIKFFICSDHKSYDYLSLYYDPFLLYTT